MMHQQIETTHLFSGRPERETVIEKDEIISLIIDMETMEVNEFYGHYFNNDEK